MKFFTLFVVTIALVSANANDSGLAIEISAQRELPYDRGEVSGKAIQQSLVFQDGTFQEGVSSKFTISIDLQGGESAFYRIQDIVLPEGASWRHAADNDMIEIIWTPALGTIAQMEWMSSKWMSIATVFLAAYEGEQVIEVKRNIYGRVHNYDDNSSLPDLISVDPQHPPFSEGIMSAFTIEFNDHYELEELPTVWPINPPEGSTLTLLADNKWEFAWAPLRSTVRGEDFSATYPLDIKIGPLGIEHRINLAVYANPIPLSAALMSLEFEPEELELAVGEEGLLTVRGHVLGGGAYPYEVNFTAFPGDARLTSPEQGVWEMHWTPTINRESTIEAQITAYDPHEERRVTVRKIMPIKVWQPANNR